MAKANKLNDTRTETKGNHVSGAIFSKCGLYRYALWRRWDENKPMLVTIGLNPSTADEKVDDNTMKKLRKLAERNGFGAFIMMNLFAYRATDPKEMIRVDEPVGPHNMFYMGSACGHANTILCAWGRDGVHKGQDEVVMQLLDKVASRTKICCLGVNNNGTPKHPLYQPDNTVFQGYGKCESSLLEQESSSTMSS